MSAHACPACGSKMQVVRIGHFSEQTYRSLECDCGERWESVETRSRRLSPVATGSHGCKPVQAGASRPPPVSAGNPPASAGGVGGGLSSDLVQVSVSPPEFYPKSLSNPDQTRARERKRTKTLPPSYPPEFEREWESTAKTGSKLRAFEAWERMGRPRLAESWERWSRTDGWQRGFVPHVATWLNDRRFEQEPVEVVKTNGAPRTRHNVEVARDWVPPEQRRAG